MRLTVLFLGLLGLTLATTGCGGGDDGEEGGTCGGADTTGCTTVLAPTGDDATALQSALIEAHSGDTLCLCPGSFGVTKELSLSVPNVTLKGVGQNITDSVLDFAGQTEGDDGVSVTSDGFTIENLAIKNSPGNGIVVTGAENVMFRKLHVSWDAGSVVTNGAYAVYPVKSTRVTIEDSEVIGAADAGIYVGQCNQAIVRRNKVHGNVAGIEIENTTDAEVYANEAFDNTAGILIFTLPNLEKKDGANASIHDNLVHDNNRGHGRRQHRRQRRPAPACLMASDDTRIFIYDREQSERGRVDSDLTLNLLLPGPDRHRSDPSDLIRQHLPRESPRACSVCSRSRRSRTSSGTAFKRRPQRLRSCVWESRHFRASATSTRRRDSPTWPRTAPTQRRTNAQ
jgi:parallel beta-helix repeat protein